VDRYRQERRNTGSVSSDLQTSKPGHHSTSSHQCGVTLKLGYIFWALQPV